MTTEMVNSYIDKIIESLTAQRDSLNELITKCEEIRTNILTEIKAL
jgi:prefoldin subunit 5